MNIVWLSKVLYFLRGFIILWLRKNIFFRFFFRFCCAGLWPNYDCIIQMFLRTQSTWRKTLKNKTYLEKSVKINCNHKVNCCVMESFVHHAMSVNHFDSKIPSNLPYDCINSLRALVKQNEQYISDFDNIKFVKTQLRVLIDCELIKSVALYEALEFWHKRSYRLGRARYFMELVRIRMVRFRVLSLQKSALLSLVFAKY